MPNNHRLAFLAELKKSCCGKTLLAEDDLLNQKAEPPEMADGGFP
jgi:hypothetical protein